jgi:Holliday junction resolvase RusA-like endonuclease
VEAVMKIEFGVIGTPVVDTQDALVLLAAIRRGRCVRGDVSSVAFVHPGEPVSKARARFNFKTRSAYTPAKTAQAEKSLAWAFAAALGGLELRSNVAVAVIFYRQNRKRTDTDNLMKLVMDAATKAGAWDDDSQVTAQAVLLELDAENPRTVIALGPIESTMGRGDCAPTRRRKKAA